MVEFLSREGTAPDWSVYSTQIYPGKITLNGDEVATRPELTDFVTKSTAQDINADKT